MEAGEISKKPWQEAAVRRAVALIPVRPATTHFDDDAGLEDGGAEGPTLEGTASKRFHLCAEERFGKQSSLADCSGLLLAADVVLTAGHCFDEGDGCDRYRYVLGYSREDDGIHSLKRNAAR
jgi:hypothetical protein